MAPSDPEFKLHRTSLFCLLFRISRNVAPYQSFLFCFFFEFRAMWLRTPAVADNYGAVRDQSCDPTTAFAVKHQLYYMPNEYIIHYCCHGIHMQSSYIGLPSLSPKWMTAAASRLLHIRNNLTGEQFLYLKFTMQINPNNGHANKSNKSWQLVRPWLQC